MMQEFGLRQNYPDNATVVDTEIPGFWFSDFSGKNVIAQTDPTVQRNEIAESVLSLSYEIQDPQNLMRAYEAKGDITDENYVSINRSLVSSIIFFYCWRFYFIHPKWHELQVSSL